MSPLEFYLLCLWGWAGASALVFLSGRPVRTWVPLAVGLAGPFFWLSLLGKVAISWFRKDI
jgi:hypothetical protein